MGVFAFPSALFVSIAVLTGAVNVDVHSRVSLRRRAVPKAGLAVTVIPSQEAYEKECEKGGLFPMVEPGVKGTIVEVDEEGEGSIMFKSDAGDEAWVPIRALVGFENWMKGGAAPPAPAPPAAAVVAPAPAAAVAAAVAVAAPAVAAAPAAPMQPVDTSPTDYMPSGCQKIEKVVDGYTLDIGMSSQKCFLRCKKQKRMKYFGMTKGGICFCTELVPGRLTHKKHCDTQCSGNSKEFCGGISNIANVYTMMDCEPPTPEEKGWLAQAKNMKLADLYGSLENQSCAQKKNKPCELNGSAKMNGTPDECKIACWKAKGAEKCDGFTYDEVQSKCKFFKDVLNGKVKKKVGLTCYFKKGGYPI